MQVSIIIPVYNEIHSLPEVVQRVCAAALPPGCTKEIIVIDDGSTDGTTLLMNEYADRGELIGYHISSNRGKGNAIREGVSRATGDVVLIQDGDFEYDPADYVALLTPVVEGLTDVVYGSRFRGKLTGMTWKNWIANKILTLAANVLYGTKITDEATAYKVFRIEVLRRIDLKCQRFEFCPEVTAKLSRLNYQIHEVPVIYHARTLSEGKKVRMKDGLEAMWTLVKYRFVSTKSFTSTTLTQPHIGGSTPTESMRL
jgi:dolichol-phosphate mannosyltransferase